MRRDADVELGGPLGPGPPPDLPHHAAMLGHQKIDIDDVAALA
jgi:hypothetical protein